MSTSIVLNIFLLSLVISAIAYVLRIKYQHKKSYALDTPQPRVQSGSYYGGSDKSYDDIIAIRKIAPVKGYSPDVDVQKDAPSTKAAPPEINRAAKCMIFLLAKEGRQIAGYELLQTLLASGFRFGEDQLFHRQDPQDALTLCSLAAATAEGTFDLHHIGAFYARGLCVFMILGETEEINTRRFNAMLESAKQLGEELDMHILDDRRNMWAEESASRYRDRLGVREAIYS